jgi:hypothetical protein
MDCGAPRLTVAEQRAKNWRGWKQAVTPLSTAGPWVSQVMIRDTS